MQQRDEQRPEKGLVLRCVRDERDVERYIAFNRDVNGEAEGAAATRLLRDNPQTRREDFVFVEDESTGEVVATTCLIPWVCRYEGIPLQVAMLEMVVTHPQYRHRGLARAQIARFHRAVAEQGHDLSIIQGIPYYYRQYGYAYALEHSAVDSLPAWRIPMAEDPHLVQPSPLPLSHESYGRGETPYSLREATDEDVPALAQLYEGTMRKLNLHVERDAAYWRYVLRSVHIPTLVLVDQPTGGVSGYVMTWPAKDSHATQIVESAVPGLDAAWAALRALRATGKQEIILRWSQGGALVQLARSLGSHRLPSYQWLWRITDVAGLLAKIAPALDRRMAAVGYAGQTDLSINLYRSACRMRIVAGRVVDVTPLGFVDASMGADGGDLCIPPEAFVRLVLGYRTLDELYDAWPDMVVKAEQRALIDLLFPRMDSCILMPY